MARISIHINDNNLFFLNKIIIIYINISKETVTNIFFTITKKKEIETVPNNKATKYILENKKVEIIILDKILVLKKREIDVRVYKLSQDIISLL